MLAKNCCFAYNDRLHGKGAACQIDASSNCRHSGGQHCDGSGTVFQPASVALFNIKSFTVCTCNRRKILFCNQASWLKPHGAGAALYLILAQLQQVLRRLYQELPAWPGQACKLVLWLQHVHMLMPQAQHREGCTELGLGCQLPGTRASQKGQLASRLGLTFILHNLPTW